MKRVLLIGDSIRLGYEPYVRGLLASEAHVLAPTENCRHSVHLALNFWNWIAPIQPDLIHFNAGLWDSRRITPQGVETVVPLGLYTRNLRVLIALMRRHTSAKLIWASTTPVDQVTYDLANARRGNAGRDASDIAAYNDAAQAVMHELEVPCNDLHGFVQRHGCRALLSDDGIHFTPSAYERIGAEVASVICDALK